MIERFIFDVDGTLTPSRGRIDPEFEKFFTEFCEDNHVYLVTGSDRKKTLEQIGFAIYNVCEAVYQCSGNDIWIGDNRISSREVAWPDALHEFFDYWINIIHQYLQKLNDQAITVYNCECIKVYYQLSSKIT